MICHSEDGSTSNTQDVAPVADLVTKFSKAQLHFMTCLRLQFLGAGGGGGGGIFFFFFLQFKQERRLRLNFDWNRNKIFSYFFFFFCNIRRAKTTT